MREERRGRLQVQHKYQKLKKAVTMSNDNEVVVTSKSTAAAATLVRRGKLPKDDNKKGNAGGMKNGNNNSKRGTDKTKIPKVTTSRKQQGVKSDSGGNVTSAAVTPAVTRQRGRPRAINAEDTTEVQSEEDEKKEDDEFLEELFNTSMESLTESDDSSDEDLTK